MAIQLLIALSVVFGMNEALNKCHEQSSCLTCSEYPYNFNCRSCSKGSFLDRDGAYYTCTSCQYPCSECHGYRLCTRCYLEGHYGERCEKVCPENCKRCISDTNCTECKDGFSGEVCEFNCSKLCYSGQCNKSSGKCHHSCKSNFEGVTCATCSNGLYGEYCHLLCHDNCITCSSNISCTECKDGFWGNACQHNCSNACVNGSCIKETGICQTGKCRTGFVGGKCDKCVSGIRGLDCSINEALPGDYSSAMRLTVHSLSYLAVVMAVGCIFLYKVKQDDVIK